MHVRSGDHLDHLLPGGAHEPALAALALVESATSPGSSTISAQASTGSPSRVAGLAEHLQQAAPDVGVLEPQRRVRVPGERRAPRATARLVIGHLGARLGVVDRLRLPGDQAVLDVDVPGAGPGAVDAMGRADDLVMRPAAPVRLLPVAVLGDELAPVLLRDRPAAQEAMSLQQRALQPSRLTHREAFPSLRQAAPQRLGEDDGVVVLGVSGAVDEGQGAVPRPAPQLRQLRALRAQLLQVAAAELLEAARLMPEPLPQPGAGRQLLLPFVETGPLPGDATRPEPVDQDAMAVRRRRGLVGPLHADIHDRPFGTRPRSPAAVTPLGAFRKRVAGDLGNVEASLYLRPIIPLIATAVIVHRHRQRRRAFPCSSRSR